MCGISSIVFNIHTYMQYVYVHVLNGILIPTHLSDLKMTVSKLALNNCLVFIEGDLITGFVSIFAGHQDAPGSHTLHCLMLQ